jgi:hypothetical protein
VHVLVMLYTVNVLQGHMHLLLISVQACMVSWVLLLAHALLHF